MTSPQGSGDKAVELEQLASQVSNPDHASYGKYLTREELKARLGEEVPEAVPARADGLERLSPWRVALLSKGIQLEEAATSTLTSTSTPQKPTEGLTPSDVAALYDFPTQHQHTGQGEVIGVLNAAHVPLARIKQDLEKFWQEFGVPVPEIITVDLTSKPPHSENEVARFDLTANVAWIGAMAPGARIVLYDVDDFDGKGTDPWSEMLAAAVAGKGGATILTSAFTTPEYLYYRECSRDRFTALAQRAAVLGISVVAAAGDWGVYNGIPSVRYRGERVSNAPWPSSVFPAAHPWVLGVGGTMITHQTPLTEVAWSGPLPPNSAIRETLALLCLASSGGFSVEWAIPDWQKQALGIGNGSETGTGRPFPRGPNLPAVLPYGRGYPDVSLAAVGPSVQRPSDPMLSATGYQLVFNGQWVDYAGGTSIASPIWGAILARMNQARVAAHKPRVGFVNPLLYRLQAHHGAHPGRMPFRSIQIGRSDVEFRTVDAQGQIARFVLEGYSALPGWDPVTGLGVPRVRQLIEASVA